MWRAENSDWPALEQYIAWVVEFRAACMKHALREQAYQHAGRSSVDVSRVQALCDVGGHATAAWQRLRNAVGWSESYLEGAPIVEILARVSALAMGSIRGSAANRGRRPWGGDFAGGNERRAGI
jgi:hypothetical protein